MVIVAFVLQFHWMQRIRRSGGETFTPNTLAEKLSQWMLLRRGIQLDDEPLDGQPGVERLECKTCMGSGEIQTGLGESQPCEICLGVGYRMIRRFHADDRMCPLCAGMGRVEAYDTGEIGPCPRCNGRGLVSAAPPRIPPSETRE